jgi:hypothetical protein
VLPEGCKVAVLVKFGGLIVPEIGVEASHIDEFVTLESFDVDVVAPKFDELITLWSSVVAVGPVVYELDVDL